MVYKFQKRKSSSPPPRPPPPRRCRIESSVTIRRACERISLSTAVTSPLTPFDPPFPPPFRLRPLPSLRTFLPPPPPLSPPLLLPLPPLPPLLPPPPCPISPPPFIMSLTTCRSNPGERRRRSATSRPCRPDTHVRPYTGPPLEGPPFPPFPPTLCDAFFRLFAFESSGVIGTISIRTSPESYFPWPSPPRPRAPPIPPAARRLALLPPVLPALLALWCKDAPIDR